MPLIYRLIALDVDGTTVKTGQPPSRRVLDALAAARARGVRVVLATGRAFDSARMYAELLDLPDPLVCFQGALVKEQSNGHHTLLAECIPAGPLGEIIQFADRRRLEFMVYGEADLYVQRQYHSQEYYDLWFNLPTHRVADLGQAARDLLDNGTPLIKGLFAGEPADLDVLEGELVDLMRDRLGVTRSHDFFLEVVAPKVSKGRALAFLARRLGISQAETIAVGDSGNDISMIRWAGLGIAMGNAQPAVLASADFIAPSVEEDGVAAVIERFVLDHKALV